MSILSYHQEQLQVEKVPLAKIAEKYGTPTYVYSRAAIVKNWQSFAKPLGNLTHHIAYAVKANSNLAILHLLANLGADFDIVSIGELEKVLAAGGNPKKIVFSGVGKQQHEIQRAIECGIRCFNIESTSELERFNAIANHLQQPIDIALRLNPDIDAKTHPYISTGLKENKFGLAANQLLDYCQSIEAPLRLTGLAMHIGSQITDLVPFKQAMQQLVEYYQTVTAAGFEINHLDIGGGLGINYHNDQAPSIEQYTELVAQSFKGLPVNICIEPGRSLVGDTGILLTRIEYLKSQGDKHFAIVNAGMNDLLRPALYDAYHPIVPVVLRHQSPLIYDIVGPVCETADFVGNQRELCIEQGDLLAIDKTGAYGFSMSSNYNSRPRPAEVLVDETSVHLIRERETFEDLMAKERLALEQTKMFR